MFSFGSVRIPVLLLSYSGGIDLGIVHSLSIGVLQKTNVIYKFKCPLGDCISDNNNIYVGLTSTTYQTQRIATEKMRQLAVKRSFYPLL